jgi:hypothetical protein
MKAISCVIVAPGIIGKARYGEKFYRLRKSIRIMQERGVCQRSMVYLINPE